MLDFDTPSEAYLTLLEALVERPHFVVGPRGIQTRELVNLKFTVLYPSDSHIITLSEERDEVMKEYLVVEKELYLSGELDGDVWAEKASKFWGKLKNPDGKINSNYGYLTLHKRDTPAGLTQWEWVKDCFERDPDTRQAIMHFNRPEHQWQGNKDFVCTLTMSFLLRAGRLHATTVMRSCDIVKGLAYDMPWFCYLLQRMAMELQVGLGTYNHLCHSLHLYEKDLSTALEMLGRE